jgi:hypothetical protein
MIQQISEAIPHRFLNKAPVVTSLSWYAEDVERGADVCGTWMCRVGLTWDLVHVKLMLVGSFSDEYFQRRIFTSSVIVFFGFLDRSFPHNKCLLEITG